MLQNANSRLVNLYTKRDRCWLSLNGWTRDRTNKVKLRIVSLRKWRLIMMITFYHYFLIRSPHTRPVADFGKLWLVKTFVLHFLFGSSEEHEMFQNNVRPALALICSCVNSCNCYNRCLLPAVIAKTGRRVYSVVLDKFATGFQGETICRHSPCINKWV